VRIVIQCAARKDPAATSLVSADGRPVLFVAKPHAAPAGSHQYYARPDDPARDGQTWRQRLVAYNAAGQNPLGLLPAYQLYAHAAYDALAKGIGLGNLFILSAGWGLIPATFLTPRYDITFSASADKWKRRRKNDKYEDLCLIPDDEPIVFVGGKDYLPLFCRLTEPLRGRKIVFFNSSEQPDTPHGFETIRYRTSIRTNWHYECARDLVTDSLEVPSG
jgi:hypothetical protein